MNSAIVTDRTHRAVSADGTAIVGRVRGDGPPLVLVHGAIADGLSEWGELVPLLADRFTCYLPDLRGRGLSDDHADHSGEARVRDVVAFVESIGGPVGLVGASGGGMVALGAAARTDAIAALSVFEPPVYETIDADTLARFQAAIDALAAGIAADRPHEAVRPFLELVANEEEVAALAADDGAMHDLAAYLPADLSEFRDAVASEGPSPTAAESLARIEAPTLLLHGSRTALESWFLSATRFVAHHVTDVTVRELVGIGHFGHVLAPERIAAELVPFFESSMGRDDS
jgi:pimeloyl-ACP methyl ester carboxylesterase